MMKQSHRELALADKKEYDANGGDPKWSSTSTCDQIPPPPDCPLGVGIKFNSSHPITD